ncbi:transcription factor SRM1-like [Apium graveolens]|uniref:transcription factor SRM1-like n=1 Tax=Apium graveolens TaxID=4045 RepID=UPI003D7B9D55
MDLYLENFSNNHFQLNSSNEIENDGYTADGWTFEENKIYENAMVDFKDTSSLPFFEHVSRLMPGKTIESIKKHNQILMEDLKFIKSSNGNFEDILEEDIVMQEETRKIEMKDKARSVTRRPRKKGIPWTEEEHDLFLKGLQQEGKGEWKTISRNYLPTKTPTQIASHAQKFEKRMHNKTPPEKRRRSINDIRFCSDQPSFSSDSQALQPNQLGFVSNSQPFPNGFVPNSHNFRPNQLNSFGSQTFQPNQFNLPVKFQQNHLGMNPQNFETNQFWNTASYNHVNNNYY